MTFLKYLASLLAAVFFATYAVCFMPFVPHAAVAAGMAQQEHLTFEFAYGARAKYFPLDTGQVQFLSQHVGLPAEGSAHIRAARLNVTPGMVSVSTRMGRLLVPGATLTADVTWDTPPDSSEGAQGRIFLSFPQLPGLEGAKPLLGAGEHKVDQAGRYVIREEAAYRKPQWLLLGRLFLAMSLGLPGALLLHTVGWYFLVMRRERRARIAAQPAQGPAGTLPRSFFPDPIAEWRTGLLVIGVFAFAATLFAYASTGVVNYAYTDFAYFLVVCGIPIAAAVADYTAATVLNLRVEWRGLSVARGRGRLQWQVIPWDHITEFRERFRRGHCWAELAFRGRWHNLKITDTAIRDYANLCTSVKQCWRRPDGPL